MKRFGAGCMQAFGILGVWFLMGPAGLWGCRATVAGDPDRPIKIEAHVTIDVRQIKEEARSIEDLVSGRGLPAKRTSLFHRGGWSGTAWAEGEWAPEVQAAIDSRRARFGQLKEYKAKGWIGEDREGHAAALEREGQALADAENRDREVIYEATRTQKGLPPDALVTIRATFAQEQRDRAEPGEKIQLPSGEWVTK